MKRNKQKERVMKKQTQWLTVPEAKKLRKIGYKLKVLVIGYQKDKYLITV